MNHKVQIEKLKVDLSWLIQQAIVTKVDDID